jgi:c-di-GMP-binding flagellar brake protein YcgR
MELSEIQVGTKLELETDAADNGRHVYASRFEWYENDDTAVIAAPIYECRVVPLEIGTSADIYFLSREGRLTNLYRFRAVVRDRGREGDLHFLLIEKQGGIVKIQRRSYFRLDVLMEVQYRPAPSAGEEQEADIPCRSTLATDLSGGGISLILEEKLERGSIVECRLFAGQPGEVCLRGRTARCDRMLRDSRYKYIAGIEFTDICDRDREKVIRYIFNEQRRLINKGMI